MIDLQPQASRQPGIGNQVGIALDDLLLCMALGFLR